MKQRVLVVGHGAWATKVAQRLNDLFYFEIKQISARSLLLNEVELVRNSKFYMLVLATRPEIQEQVILQCLGASNHIWLEKPISRTFEGGQKLFSMIESKASVNSLVNFSWTFSAIWIKFKSLDNDFNSVIKVEVYRSAYSETHTYMESIEDYGSHDIALMIDWVTSKPDKEIEFEKQNFGRNHFFTLLNNIPIIWKIEFGSQKKRMIWSIAWKEGETTIIDFYENIIVHKGERISLVLSDNIKNFVTVLDKSDKSTEKRNHQQALMTKEFFCL